MALRRQRPVGVAGGDLAGGVAHATGVLAPAGQGRLRGNR
jgi:hypothetical protein